MCYQTNLQDNAIESVWHRVSDECIKHFSKPMSQWYQAVLGTQWMLVCQLMLQISLAGHSNKSMHLCICMQLHIQKRLCLSFCHFLIPFLVYLCKQGSKFFLSPSSGLSRPRLLQSLSKRQEENLGPTCFWVWIFESPQSAASSFLSLSALIISSVIHSE